MVQALAFAELFAGGILFLCGYKGYTPAAVVKGEAGAARPLGAPAASSPSSSSTGTSAGGPAAPGTGTPHQSAGSSPFGTAKAPAQAGALTWQSLERDIKAHKLTEAQVKADLAILTNHPPAK